MTDAFPLPHGLRPGGRYDSWRPAVPEYVLCDVDGTIIGETGAVRDAVREASAHALAAGLHVGFATGRGSIGLSQLSEALGLPGPHVVANGGQVIHRGRAVTTSALPHDVAEALLSLGTYAEFYTDDGMWVTSWDERARPHWELLGAEPSGVIGEDGAAPDLAATAKVTVVLFGEREVDRRVRAAIGSLSAEVGTGTSPATPGLEYVNVTARGADKGTALRAAAEVLSIDVAATVAVGDERNDVPMLSVAGTAVAMGQSADAVIDVAHLVAPTVAEDGLATVLTAAVGWRG